MMMTEHGGWNESNEFSGCLCTGMDGSIVVQIILNVSWAARSYSPGFRGSGRLEEEAEDDDDDDEEK